MHTCTCTYWQVAAGLFRAYDCDGSGAMSLEQFEHFLEDMRAEEAAAKERLRERVAALGYVLGPGGQLMRSPRSPASPKKQRRGSSRRLDTADTAAAGTADTGVAPEHSGRLAVRQPAPTRRALAGRELSPTQAHTHAHTSTRTHARTRARARARAHTHTHTQHTHIHICTHIDTCIYILFYVITCPYAHV